MTTQAVKKQVSAPIETVLPLVVSLLPVLLLMTAIILGPAFQNVLMQAAVMVASNQIAALAQCSLNAKTRGIVPKQPKTEEFKLCVPPHVRHARPAVITSPVLVLTAHRKSVIQLAPRMIEPIAQAVIVLCAIVLAQHASMLAVMLNNTQKTRYLCLFQDQLPAPTTLPTSSAKR